MFRSKVLMFRKVEHVMAFLISCMVQDKRSFFKKLFESLKRKDIMLRSLWTWGPAVTSSSPATENIVVVPSSTLIKTLW